VGGLNARQLFTIIVLAIISADAIMVFLFSRGDPNLRVAALVGTSGIAVAEIAIASTLLTGKDLTHRDPSDLPGGSVVTDMSSSTLKVPPINPPAA